MATTISSTFNEAELIRSSNPQKAMELYQSLLKNGGNGVLGGEEAKRVETAILRIAEIIKSEKESSTGAAAEILANYIRSLQGSWNVLPRAKTARILTLLLDHFETLSNGKIVEMSLTKELVEWSIQENRTFLKQSLEIRLVSLYLTNKLYSDALALVGRLLKELKKLEDKVTLVEVHLLECRIYYALRNGPKSKAALTAARSNANSIYCPPLLQASLDMQSALLHADDSDFKTASSYFVEALDSFSQQNDPRGAIALKYLLLCRIMLDHSDEIDFIVNGKTAIKYSIGEEVKAMKAVAQAWKNKSLSEFENALAAYPDQLGSDPMIHTHFQSLYEQLLHKNILRIVSLYSEVQISYIAESIGLPASVIENKLAMMIVDKQLNAIIDQYSQSLIILKESVSDNVYQHALKVISNLDKAVDALHSHAAQI